MSIFSSISSPFSEASDFLRPSELEGFPVSRPYTKTRYELNSNSQRREIGHLGVWTLSSAKQGNGVEQLTDRSNSTFWQSDGTQPHSLTIYFPRKLKVSEICVYLDFKQDESYTPNKVSVFLGDNLNNLCELQTVDLEEPVGWFNFSLGRMESGKNQPTKAHYVQFLVLSNQHNGRDTHIRQIKIFGPREDFKVAFPNFNSEVFSKFEFLR